VRTVEMEGYAGKPIHSLSDWEEYAMPPDRKRKHWTPGRSACELGRVWTANGEPETPIELTQLLNSHDATRGTVIRKGVTECETRLPPVRNGPRCHDLVLLAEQRHSTATICIEAKADEPFGGTVAEELQKARKRPFTKFPERLDWLTRSLLGLPAFSDEGHSTLSNQIRGLPYQLFAAIAGTLLEAQFRRSTKAVLVIHEFRTEKTEDEKIEHNARELESFLRFVLKQNGATDDNFKLHYGQLIGPLPLLERAFRGVSKMPHDIPLFVGKVRTDRTAVCTRNPEG